MTGGIAHRTVEANGIKLHLAEQGKGPLVLLCHGFPECWHSWRHQLPALASAGYHAVAPDMRGHGRSDAPEAIDQYTLFHLVGDMVKPIPKAPPRRRRSFGMCSWRDLGIGVWSLGTLPRQRRT